MSTDLRSSHETDDTLVLGTLITIIILILFTLSAPIFEKFHFHYMHESGLCMLIGLAFACINYFFAPLGKDNIKSLLLFNGDVFFNLILPPIIFAAGYNLKRKGFYKYLLYIISYGLIGTIINFGLVAPITYLFSSNNMFYVSHLGDKFDALKAENPNIFNEPINFSIKEVLLYAAVISATDSVAALTFINEDNDPKLFPILFGEGVINDAVCIVLYKVVLRKLTSDERKNLIYYI